MWGNIRVSYSDQCADPCDAGAYPCQCAASGADGAGPTLDETAVQTPTDFGYNTRVVDGDIHVWHAPHCPPVPPATFVASIILTHLVSPYSYLHLKRDGTVTGSNYRTEEARERFAKVLGDSTLMERILASFECP